MSGKSKFDWVYALSADPGIHGTHKHIGTYIALRNLERHEPTFRVRQATVAENCGTDVRTVKRAYRALRDGGWIELVARRGRQSGVDQYRLRFPDGTNLGDTNGPSPV